VSYHVFWHRQAESERQQDFKLKPRKSAAPLPLKRRDLRRTPSVMQRSEQLLCATRATRATRAMLVTCVLVAAMLAGCGAAPVTGAQRSPSPTPAATTAPAQRYTATLSPLNASGVSATARLELSGNVLVVTLHATGLEPNREHYLHIHGYPDATVTCPATSGGAISVDEGIAHVGPIALDLQPYPQVTGPGTVDWSHTYTLSPDDLYNITPLTGHVLVLHGLTTNGTYNRATFVACGQIQAA
jgi:Cu/Zn superoxide dismutase